MYSCSLCSLCKSHCHIQNLLFLLWTFILFCLYYYHPPPVKNKNPISEKKKINSTPGNLDQKARIPKQAWKDNEGCQWPLMVPGLYLRRSVLHYTSLVGSDTMMRKETRSRWGSRNRCCQCCTLSFKLSSSHVLSSTALRVYTTFVLRVFKGLQTQWSVVSTLLSNVLGLILFTCHHYSHPLGKMLLWGLISHSDTTRS